MNLNHVAQKGDMLSRLARYYLVIVCLFLFLWLLTLLLVVLHHLGLSSMQRGCIFNASLGLRLIIRSALHFSYIFKHEMVFLLILEVRDAEVPI